MRIGIDARFYGTLGKGLGRYTQQLITYLEKVDTKNSYLIFLRSENFDAYIPKSPNFKKVLADIPWYSWKEQFVFPRLLLQYHCDVVHFTHFNVPIFYRRPFVLTVHDLILFHFPTIRATTRSVLGYWMKYLMYRIILWSALNRAKHIISVSQYTRDDISKNFHIEKEKMIVTYQAATDIQGKENGKGGRCDSRTLASKYGILNKYFLYVGNAYPHKNLERLLEAFRRMGDLGIMLVFVGKKDYFYERLQRYVGKRSIRGVVFTGEVTDGDLECLYRGAVAYVFPSLYEGFGLPPFEAMALGTPVIAASRSALPEVLGSAALYFDPEDIEDMIKKLVLLLNDEKLRLDLVEKGYRRAKKFSWEKLAQDTQRVYESL